MNREILFRGKTKKSGEWVEGNYEWYHKSEKHLMSSPYGYSCSTVGVIPETVGQFTGLIDKNNKKIFEGDIVKGRFLYGREVLSVVAFKDGAFGLEWNRGDIKEFDAFTQMCNIEYEVIGNIFDKPEIL